MSKKLSGIISIALGVAIIIIGIVAMTVAPDPEGHATSYQYVRSAEFGADFYTYMYDASYSMVQQLNSIDRGFSDIAKAEAKTQQSIHTVGGLLMICLGLGVAAMGVNAMGQEPAAPVPYCADPVDNVPQTQPEVKSELKTEGAEAEFTPLTQVVASHDQKSDQPAGQKFDANRVPAWKRVQMEQEDK